MITVTAVIMSIIPKPTLFVKGSPNMKIPTHTAVTGSIAPKTEVSVEPIHFTALTSARLEITVGIMASITRFPAVCRLGIGWVCPVVPIPMKRSRVPKRKT